MTLGNASDAALAATMPAGYLIGSGFARNAYLINGVVYKVSEWPNDNHCEFANIMRVRDKATDVIRFPEVALYGDVIAMEYIEGRETGSCVDCELGSVCQYGDCMPTEVMLFLDRLGFTDIGHGNIIEDCGRFYLIDAVS